MSIAQVSKPSWNCLFGCFIAAMVVPGHAATLAPSSVLVSYLEPNYYTTSGYAGTLIEFTQGGGLLQKFDVQLNTGDSLGFQMLRGVAVGSDARMYVFNGTFSPAISAIDLATMQQTHVTAPQWGVIGSISAGAVAPFGSKVFASNNYPVAATYGVGGMIEIDLSTGAPVYFGDTLGYQDVTMGLDGLLYGLNYQGALDVFNPNTRQLLERISIASAPEAIAVDASGQIFAAQRDGTVSRIARSGETVGAFIRTGESLIDIDLNAHGDIVLGTRFGRVITTSDALLSWSSFATQPVGWAGVPVHVSFSNTVSVVPELPAAFSLMLGLILLSVRRRSAAV